MVVPILIFRGELHCNRCAGSTDQRRFVDSWSTLDVEISLLDKAQDKNVLGVNVAGRATPDHMHCSCRASLVPVIQASGLRAAA